MISPSENIEERQFGESHKNLFVDLQGGLGNQLFQLAAAIVLSRRTGRKVHLDPWRLHLSCLPGVQRRRVSIGALVQDGEVLSLVSSLRHRLFDRGSRTEHELGPLDTPLERTNVATRRLVGYFQQIAIVNESWCELEKRIVSSSVITRNAVKRIAIHIRCGDYMKPSARRFHGLTASDYYKNALREVSKVCSFRDIYVVSDDPKMARRLLGSYPAREGFQVDFGTGIDEWQDLLELASSAAIIMNNSSFSWWGAFLATKWHDSFVVVPSPWFAEDSGVELLLFHPNWRVIDRNLLSD